MTRMRRFVGAGLPAAGFTVLAALALGQPVSAAPHTDRAPLGLSVLDGYALENATAGGAGGVGTANQAVLPVRLPVTVACNAIGVLGDARAACAGAVPSAEPSGSSDGYYGGGGRGNGGSGTATAGPGGDNGGNNGGGGRGNGGYGTATTPPGGSAPSPPGGGGGESPAPSPTGPDCCGLSPAGGGEEGEGEEGGELPVTGLPVLALAAGGGLLAGGGLALRYAVRRRRA